MTIITSHSKQTIVQVYHADKLASDLLLSMDFCPNFHGKHDIIWWILWRIFCWMENWLRESRNWKWIEGTQQMKNDINNKITVRLLPMNVYCFFTFSFFLQHFNLLQTEKKNSTLLPTKIECTKKAEKSNLSNSWARQYWWNCKGEERIISFKVFEIHKQTCSVYTHFRIRCTCMFGVT